MNTEADAPPEKGDHRRRCRADHNSDLIRGWPVSEGSTERELLIRKDAVAWVIACKGDLAGKTLIGLRTAGAKAIPVSADYAAVKAWWTGGSKAKAAMPSKHEGQPK